MVKKKPVKQTSAYSLTRKGVVTWFCLIFFISAWMFVLGVLVGRGTAPVRFDISGLQEELADLRRAVIKKEEKRYRINQTSDPDKSDLGFYEILKKKKDDSEKFTGDFVESGKSSRPEELKTAGAAAAPEAEPKKAKVSLKSLTFKSETVKSKVIKPETLAKIKKEQPVGKFIVQVASTKESKAADRLVRILKTKGYAAYRVSASILDKGTWHRVRVGGFQTKAAGEAVKKRLKKDGFDGLVLKR